jgi:hypothetical protein
VGIFGIIEFMFSENPCGDDGARCVVSVFSIDDGGFG